MKIILRLAPAFLKRFDDSLRMNAPWFWATRFHINIYLGIILLSLVVLLAALMPLGNTDLIGLPENTRLINLLFFPVVAWLILSFRQLSLYNVDKSHGEQGTYREFLVLLIYFLTFLLPLAMPAIATSIIEYRIGSHLWFGGVSWKFAIIAAFGLAVLFSIYKQVKAAHFFLNFAVMGGLMFVLGLLSHVFMEEKVFIHGLMVFIIAILIFVLVMLRSPRYHGLMVQGVVFLNTVVPVIGLILWFYADFGLDLVDTPVFDFSNLAREGEEFSPFNRSYFDFTDILLWGGFILHLFLWNSLFKIIYHRTWNLPKAK